MGGRVVFCAFLALLISGRFIDVFAQAGPQPDYSVLIAHSAALSPADQAAANQLFATSFSLWQSGDFAAAEIGFKQGLDIDPANALANYYYGDCLARRKDKAAAKGYLARAVAVGGTTAEGLKAQAELQALSMAPTNIADMDPKEIRGMFVGRWDFDFLCATGSSHDPGADIKVDENGKVSGLEHFESNGFRDGRVEGDGIQLHFSSWGVEGRLVSPVRMEGRGTGRSSTCTWSAIKQ